MHDHQESGGGGLVVCLFLMCAVFVAVMGTGLVSPI
jgi:hypothetical protein